MIQTGIHCPFSLSYTTAKANDHLSSVTHCCTLRSACSRSHLGFDIFWVLGLVFSFQAWLPGVLCLLQVDILFYTHSDNLPGLSPLAWLRSPRSNIQQLGQKHSLLYPLLNSHLDKCSRGASQHTLMATSTITNSS